MTRLVLPIVLGFGACAGAPSHPPVAQPSFDLRPVAPPRTDVPRAAVARTESATTTPSPAGGASADAGLSLTASTPAAARSSMFCMDSEDPGRWKAIMAGPTMLPSPPKAEPNQVAPGPVAAGGQGAENKPPRGDLNKEILRRVIRHHISDVKNCYEAELAQNPKLGGRILVRFTIASSGRVTASALQDSTMGNARVETCTVEAVRGWEFPKPCGGGYVVVSYPFVLTPAPGGE